MSMIRRALARLLAAPDNVTIRIVTEHRIAQSVRPIIDRLAADNEDGSAYRSALIAWFSGARPPIAIYQGDDRFCRIDGPLQWAGDYPFPIGGLVLSPGFTAHLNPFEANDLRDRMRRAIESTIIAWLDENGPRHTGLVPVQIDRTEADRKGKAMIAEWMARKQADQSAETQMAEARDHG